MTTIRSKSPGDYLCAGASLDAGSIAQRTQTPRPASDMGYLLGLHLLPAQQLDLSQDAPPAEAAAVADGAFHAYGLDQIRSEEHTSEIQSLMRISYAVFGL